MIKFKKHLFTFFLLLAIFTTVSYLPAHASSLWDQAQNSGLKDIGREAYGQEQPTRDVYSIIINIIKIMLGLLGLIFLIYIITAGYSYMTAAGNEEQTKKAMAQIRNGVIGLLIILSSYAIASFVINLIKKTTTDSV